MNKIYKPIYKDIFDDLTRDPSSSYSSIKNVVERREASILQKFGVILREDAKLFLIVNLYYIVSLPWEKAHGGRSFMMDNPGLIENDLDSIYKEAADRARSKGLVEISSRLLLEVTSVLYQKLRLSGLNVWG